MTEETKQTDAEARAKLENKPRIAAAAATMKGVGSFGSAKPNTGLKVKCLTAEGKNEAVKVNEGGDAPHEAMRLVRRFFFATEGTDPQVMPQLRIEIASLDPLPYETGKVYSFSLTEVSK